MNIMDILTEILTSKIRAEIFRLLFGLSNTPLHTREIKRRSGLTIGTVQQELRKLLRLGLVTRRRDGNRVYYEANKAHPLYIEIHRMVLKTVGLADLLRKTLKDERVKWAFVFGSIARKDETSRSDIDLMVIGGIGLRAVTGLLSGVAEQVGREINPHVFRVEEFLKRVEARDHFISQVLKEPRLFIIGDSDEFERLAGQQMAQASRNK